MSLILEVKVNSEHLGVVAIQRVTNLRVERPDAAEMNRYKVTSMLRGAPTEHRVVEHTYADGAMVLIRKALEALEASSPILS